MEDNQILTRVISATPIRSELSSVTFADISMLLRRYMWVIAGVFLLTVAGAYSVISMMTEQYDTEAELLVKIGRENLDPPAVSRNVPFSAGLRHEELMSEIEILKSPDLLVKVVDEIGPEKFKPHRVPPATFIGSIKESIKSIVRGVKEQYGELLIALDLKKRLDDRQKAIAGLTDNLIVEPVKDSDVMAVRLRMPDPGLAREIEARLIQDYLVRRVEVRRTPGVQEFLDQMAHDRQRALVAAEARSESWKRESGITSATEQKSLLLKQIRDLVAAEASSSGEINAAARQVEASQKIITSTPEYQRSAEQETPNPARQSIEEKLIALRLQRSQDLQKYRPESGTITAIDQSIARLTDLLQKEKTTQVGSVTMQLNPNRQAAEQSLHQNIIRLEGLRAMNARQKTEITSLTAELNQLQVAETRLTDIERTRKVAEQDYEAVIKRKFDSDVSTELDKDRVSNVSIARSPFSTLEPVYPRKLLIMAIALAAGLILGTGLALLLHYMDDRIDDPTRLELQTQIAHLGTLDAGQPA